jgi:hypothetical protein
MLRHIVCLKFKASLDKVQTSAALSAALKTLPAKESQRAHCLHAIVCHGMPLDRFSPLLYATLQIPEIKGYLFGADAGLDPEKNHDFVIVADFADLAAYKKYSTHPEHMEVVVQVIKPVIADGGRVAVQCYFPSSL